MRRSRDAGESLIEVLITLMLVGIGVTAVLGALMTGLRGSRSTQQTTDSRSLLVGAAEQIQAADYVKCAGLTGYTSAIATTVAPVNADGTNTSSVSVTVVSIGYWSSDSAGVQGFSGACIASSYDNNPAAASRMQRITLRATSDENLTIVKRAP